MPDYQSELRKLRDQLLLMGANVEEMISSSVRALIERDSDLARRMIEHDHAVNRLERETDQLCLHILALRHPLPTELRFITIALKLVTDLERIGDLAVNVCERVIELNQDPPLSSFRDLSRMAEAARAMLREALDAFVQGDAWRAQRVLEQDRAVDAYNAQIFRDLLADMMENPKNIYRATRVQSIAKSIERIGDHATNVAEMVVFMVKGEDIRHLGNFESSLEKPVPHGVLFVCQRNSAQSQMAEAWARKLLPSGVRVWSAGSEPAPDIHPLAVRVMKEVGLDLSGQRPKHVGDVPIGDVDTVITLCAEGSCASLPAALRREAWALADPAAAAGSEQERASEFRRIRDELRPRVESLLKR
ncbi:MAG TPA: phosphate signaling complex protein PhoU [Polyangiaceae bacterium]|nr:phosphate signaling complex protein PhoU [Polyangiaceae bacterium]